MRAIHLLCEQVQSVPRAAGRRAISVKLRRFLADSQGEASPVSYLLALIFSLIFLFFTVDLGLRSGTRLGVEYAAYCAARAAATQLPRQQERGEGACVDGDEKKEVERAAAACLSSVAPKNGLRIRDDALVGLPGPLNDINRLVSRTLKDVEVKFDKQCYRHNELVKVSLSYRDRMAVPLSPLNWVRRGPLVMTAQSQAMLHTVQ